MWFIFLTIGMAFYFGGPVIGMLTVIAWLVLAAGH